MLLSSAPRPMLGQRDNRVAGLVEEIQAQAIDRKSSVSDLLRKVKLAAVKLNLDEAVEWGERELTGYTKAEDVPDYRIIRGSMFSHPRFHGQMAISGDPETVIKLSTQRLFEPIASLESLLDQESNGTLMIKLDEWITHRINQLNGGSHHPIYIHFTRSVIVTIIDRVRNMVLDWAVGLERQGIMGEGLSFSVAEKEKAASVGQTITIGTLYGGMNNASVTGDNNTTTVSAENSVQVDNSIFTDLSSAIESNVTDAADKEIMLALVEQLNQERGKSGFRLPFANLMEYAANYATVLGSGLIARTGRWRRARRQIGRRSGTCRSVLRRASSL